MGISYIDVIYSFILSFIAIIKIPIPASMLKILNTQNDVANYKFWGAVTRFMTVEMGFLVGNFFLSFALWPTFKNSGMITNNFWLGVVKIIIITFLYWLSFLLVKYRATPEEEEKIIRNYKTSSDLPNLSIPGSDEVEFNNYFKVIMVKPMLISMIFIALSFIIAILVFIADLKIRIY